MKRPRPTAVIVYLILVYSTPVILSLSTWDNGTIPFWFCVLLGIIFMIGSWGVMDRYRILMEWWKHNRLAAMSSEEWTARWEAIEQENGARWQQDNS